MTDRYREHAPPPALTPYVSCTWRNRVAASEPSLVRPDGCLDLVVYPDGTAHVAGPDTTPAEVRLDSGDVVGLRFRIGRAADVLGMPAAELRDQRVPLEDVWDRTAAEALQAELVAADVDGRRALLIVAVEARLAGAPRPDDLVAAAVASLAHGRRRVTGLAAELAVSERQLRRRFDRAVGYGQTLDRVLRARRLLRALERGAGDDLARLALELGYADQAHMTRDARELLGGTPGALRPAAAQRG